MGLFDRAKSQEEKKHKELMQKLNSEIFPGGIMQIEREIGELRALLNFRYTKEEVKLTFIYASAIFFVSDDKSPDRIVTSILNEKNSVITKDDAYKLVSFLYKKFKISPLQASVIKTISEMNDGDKIFMIVKGGIVELKKTYKDLTDKGKFEVIIFNSLLALHDYSSKYPSKYSKTFEQFFKALMKQAKEYQINMDSETLAAFVNTRFNFYAQEIENISTVEGNIPSRIYSAFYLTPLKQEPDLSRDLGEIMLFYIGLNTMMDWIINNLKKI